MQFPPSREFAGSTPAAALVNQFELGDTAYDDTAIDFFEDYAVGAITSLNEGTGWRANGVVENGTIVSRTHASGYAMKALSLANGQLGRRMPWLDQWNRLRLVVGIRINGTASFNTVATGALFGVCSGITNMPKSATCDNFIGLRFGSGAGETCTFTAGTRVSYYNMGTSNRHFTKRGTTETQVAAGGSGHAFSAFAGHINFYAFRVNRPVFANNSSSVTYTMLEMTPQASEVEFSRSKNALRQLLQDDAGATSASTQDQTTGGFLTSNTTVSFDQSTGILDAFAFSWPESTNPVEIYCMGVRKIA